MRDIPCNLKTRLDEVVDDAFGAGGFVGLATALVVDGEIAWFKGLGYSDVEKRSVPDRFTTSRVASITKTFTATSILRLRDAGMLELEDPLLLHVPEFTTARALAGTLEGVTIKRMLTHHSGLSTETPVPTWEKPEFPDAASILDALPDSEVVIPQDSQWKYSNFAFGLLGEVVHRLTGKPYTDYVASEILKPLGMEQTSFNVEDIRSGRMATGYLPALEPHGEVRLAPYAHMRGLSSAGQLHSNAHDLAKWIGFHTGAVKSDVLDGRTLDEMHRPVYLEPDWSRGQALGWRAMRRGYNVYLEHGGGIHGYSSQVLFNKPSRVGAITLSNVWPPVGMSDLAAALMDAALDELEDTALPPEPPAPETSLPDGIEEFMGGYFAEPYMAVELLGTGASLAMRPVGRDTNRLHAPCDLAAGSKDGGVKLRVVNGRGAGETLDFRRRDDGEIDGFLLGGFYYRRTD